MSRISPTAVVDPGARLGEQVIIGPGCVVEADTVIGDHCELRGNVFIAGGTKLGRSNRIFANCVLGEEPQIIGLVGPKTELIIGNNNTLRENVVISRGSPQGGGKTVIGDDNFLMIGSHLGHDCEVEHHAVVGNYCQIGGHSKIEHHAWLSAYSGTHQFVTIGRYAYMAAYAGPTHDIPPYVRASGAYPCQVRGVNLIGLQRGGMDEEAVAAIEIAYRALYRKEGPRNIAAAVDELSQQPNLNAHVIYLLEFIRRSIQHRFNRYRELFRNDRHE
jgi:UDP-N-acetylglucosamine acyltransferase